MKKRVIGLILALCLMLGLLPGTVSAAADRELPEAVMLPAARPAEVVRPMAGTYTITLTSSGPGTAELYTTSANARERIYFLADPEPGHRVSFDKSGYYMDQYEMELYYIGGNMYEIVMPDGDVKLDLEFVPIETESHPVTVTVSEGGMVTVSQTEAKAGESIFLEIITAPAARLGDVRASSGGTEVKAHPLGRVEGAELYELFMPEGALEITVEFLRNGPYPLEAIVFSGTEQSGGALELSHTEAYEGETVTVTAIPDRGWELADITTKFNSELTQVAENVWTFPMPRHGEEVHATFSIVPYPVSVTVEEPVGGTAVLDAESATIGQTVTLTCTPDEGYRVARITGLDTLTDNGDGTYTFVMDNESVALSVLFLRENNPFLDVNETHFYHDSVIWAVEKGITNGVDESHFGPFGVCNRAQVVTFLWRAAGSPASGAENPFTDVPDGTWYTEAVLWAVEQGITNGLTETTFGPLVNANRAHVVTFLWRAEGKPAAATTENPFSDVKAEQFYTDAVLWAVENQITNGMGDGTFGVDTICNRAHVVTFLYRAMVE